MFFCGVIGVEGFCWCEVGYGYLQVKSSVFSWCEVSYGYLWVLSLNECTDFTMYQFVYVVLCINRYRYRYRYTNRYREKRYLQ